VHERLRAIFVGALDLGADPAGENLNYRDIEAADSGGDSAGPAGPLVPIEAGARFGEEQLVDSPGFSAPAGVVTELTGA
jgi:hypothetical protein